MNDTILKPPLDFDTLEERLEKTLKRKREEALKEGESMSEWISVKDGVPELDKEVLALSKHENSMYVAWREKRNQHDDHINWCYSYCCGCKPDYEITHWMPLPTPPN